MFVDRMIQIETLNFHEKKINEYNGILCSSENQQAESTYLHINGSHLCNNEHKKQVVEEYTQYGYVNVNIAPYKTKLFFRDRYIYSKYRETHSDDNCLG